MKLLLPEIDYKNGFGKGNDIFDRKKLALQMESIIKNSEDDSLVLAIDDQWGNGKTTFLKMWEHEISDKKEFEVIYFDAFQNDYQEDAFLALSSAIYPRIESVQDKADYLKAATNVGKFIVRTSIKIGLRAATLGILKDTDFEQTADAIKEAIEEPIEKIIEEKLKSAENEVEIIQHFKDTITASAENKKIIFIIDELDRARPDFSLDLLEKIKHVFNTRRLFFVLSLNKEQFKKIIQKRYGEIDSETYLSKFIHFWLALPRPIDHRGNSNTIKLFFDHLTKNLKIESKYKKSIEVLSYILEANNPSLRDCERCYSLLMLINASGSPEEQIYQHASAMLVFFKIKRPDIFSGLVLRSIEPIEVYNALNPNKIKVLKVQYLHSIIISDLCSDEELNKAEENKEIRVMRQNFGEPIKSLQEVAKYFESVIL